MLLAADIGNTHIKLGLYRGAKLLESWRLASDERRTVDEHGLFLRQLLGARLRGVRRVAVASVVPPVEADLVAALGRYLPRVPVSVIDHRAPFGFVIGYRPPTDVGTDRLVDAAAAVALVGAPVIVVDFGTAVTLNVVSRERVYLGGAILPGVELAAASLFRRTTKLPQVTFARPAAAIGRSTVESLRSGLLLGCAASVDVLLERMFVEVGSRPPVVATGGTASLVTPLCRNVRRVEPDLTLAGIRLVAERMGRKRARS